MVKRLDNCRVLGMIETELKDTMRIIMDNRMVNMWWKTLTHTHSYSGRDDHGGTIRPPESYSNLAAWCNRCGIDALGMGSPYTPRTAANYARFDGDDRDVYYRPDFDKQALLNGDDVADMLQTVNQIGQGRTLFYLDNETPKGRFGHMWWIGHRRDMPEWHDYDQPFDRWMVAQSLPGECADEPMAYERRPYLQILATQRASGALGIWAHPTSWWPGDRGQFVTNIASEMPAHVIAEGRLDGMVVMGYHPYRPQYQKIWFELLDRGYRVPGVAEADAGLSNAPLWQTTAPMLTHVYHESGTELSVAGLCEGFRSGRVFASSGPQVELMVDGQPMGQVARTGPDMRHQVELAVRGTGCRDRLARVEILGRGGRLLWRREDVAHGTIKLPFPGLAQKGYLIARVFQDYPEHWRDVRAFAVSNPVYLHPAGTSFEAPATTAVEIQIHDGSPINGAEIRLETMNGELLSTTVARAGRITETLPASGRVTIVTPDGQKQTDYLVNANANLMAVQRYLYRGKFLKDFPSLTPGEVPPEAWHIDKYVEAMRQLMLEY